MLTRNESYNGRRELIPLGETDMPEIVFKPSPRILDTKVSQNSILSNRRGELDSKGCGRCALQNADVINHIRFGSYLPNLS